MLTSRARRAFSAREPAERGRHAPRALERLEHLRSRQCTYRTALCDLIRAKRKGEDVHVAAAVDEREPPDLLAALHASLAGSRNGDLSELSKAELDERAKKAKIPGRSKMTKDELVEALSRAA